jgi:hypothetical protein
MDNRYAYVLLFDRDDQINYKEIHDKLVALSCIKNWFHYIKSSYILISDKSTANALDKEVGTIFREINYLVLGIDLKDSQGWLPKKAWEWIERQSVLL